MSQASLSLRKVQGGHGHWCPGCREMHVVPDSWTFDGNLNRPTFNPSVRIRGYKLTRDAEGKWTGGWERDDRGTLIPTVCHYHLHGGVLKYCADGTHDLAGKDVPLPPLPTDLRDETP